MKKENYEVRVVVNGQKIKEFGHENKTYIEARKGLSYTINVKNNTPHRTLCVPSVDGISVLDGEEATERSGGYILNAHSSLEIKGFRISDLEVRNFLFGDKEKSYAKLSPTGGGSTINCGAIAIRFIEEKITCVPFIKEWFKFKQYPTAPYIPPRKPQPPVDPWPSVDPWFPNNPHGPYIYRKVDFEGDITFSNSLKSNHRESVMYCSSSNTQDFFDTGTEFGKTTIKDAVKTVEFERGESQVELVIYYSSKEGLKALGVPMETIPQVAFPQPFKKYCQPPKE